LTALLGQHAHCDVRADVAVQRDDERMLADVLERPVGIRMAAFSTSKPCALSASTMSTLVTEPNSRPSTPAFWLICTRRPSSCAPCSCATSELLGGDFLEIERFASSSAMFSGVARFALPCGDQVVAREAVLDLDDVAEVADVGDLFEQNDLHRRPSAQCRSVYGTSARKRARLIAVDSWRW
jgi:hypothetical protein